MFDMDYQQIQGVIRDWVEETYNLKGLTPNYNINSRLFGGGRDL